MPVDFAFQIDPETRIERPLVVVGSPTIGLVGLITAHHIVQTLGMRLVGGVRSQAFPPLYYVKDGKLLPPIRVFSADVECGGGVACSQLVVITTEFRPSPPLMNVLADALMAWVKRVKAPLVIVPDGVPADEDEQQTNLYGVASGEGALSFLDSLKVGRFPEGMLVGFSGALLESADRAGVDAVCLLGETHPEYPDARAAAHLVGSLTNVLPPRELDPAPLLDQATEIERGLRDLQRRLRDRVQREPSESAPETMFG